MANFNWLLKFDLFASKFQVSFQNMEEKRSYIGVCLSFITLLVQIPFFIQIAKSYFIENKPNIYSSSIEKDSADIVWLNNTDSKNLQFMLKSSNMEILLDEFYFETSFYRYLRQDINGKLNKSRIPLGIEKCSLNKFTKSNLMTLLQNNSFNSNYLQLMENIDNYYCPKDKDFQIGGEFNSNFYSNIYFEIKRCDPKLKKCASKDHIDSILSDNTLTMPFVFPLFNPDNYTHPIMISSKDYWIKLDATMYTQVEFFPFKEYFSTDIGFLEEDLLTFYYYNRNDDFKKDINFARDDNLVLRFYMTANNLEINTMRYYKKITDVFGELGGLVEIFFLVAGFISQFFNNYSMQEQMINSFFFCREKSTSQLDKVFSKKIDLSESMIKNECLKNNDPDPNIDNNIRKIEENQREQEIQENKKLKKSVTFMSKSTARKEEDENKAENDYSMRKLKDTQQPVIKKRIEEIKAADEKGKDEKKFKRKTEKYNTSSRINNLDLKKDIPIPKHEYKQSCSTNVEVHYELDTWTILKMNFCCCFLINRKMKHLHNKYYAKMIEYTDYEQVIYEVISFKNFKKNFPNTFNSNNINVVN